MSLRNAPILACLASLWPVFAAGSDADRDGVADALDVCPNTPSGIQVTSEGRPVGNLDGDCDVDLEDSRILQISFPSLDDLAVLAANMTGPMRCGIPDSQDDIELRYAIRRVASEGATGCLLPASETDYLLNTCFFVEVFAADARPDPLGITCVFFDVDLGDAECPLGVVHGGTIVVADTFPDFQSGSIPDSDGKADEVGGCTTETGVGVDEWVLVATIRGSMWINPCLTTVSLKEAEADSSVVGGGSPAQIGFGEPTEINITCTGVIYDHNGNECIDVGDFSFFAGCRQQTPPYSPDCETADYNCDGVIDDIDFSFFETANRKLICAGGIDIPSCQEDCR